MGNRATCIAGRSSPSKKNMRKVGTQSKKVSQHAKSHSARPQDHETSKKQAMKYCGSTGFDAAQAPAPLEEDRVEWHALLKLLQLFPGRDRYLVEELNEAVLIAICALPGSNCSVVSLLLYSYPQSILMRSPKTGLSALQTAMLHGAPLDVITLLYDAEVDKHSFCATMLRSDQHPLDEGKYPLEHLLLHVRSPLALRNSPRKHRLFMRFCSVYPTAMQRLDAAWGRYYRFWRWLGQTKLHEFNCSFPNVFADDAECLSRDKKNFFPIAEDQRDIIIEQISSATTFGSGVSLVMELLS